MPLWASGIRGSNGAVFRKAFERIGRLKEAYGLSTGFIYNMLQFSKQAEAEKGGNIAAGMWRSRFAYRTRRHVNDSKNITDKNNGYAQLTEAFYQNGIGKLGAKYRIPLFNHFLPTEGKIMELE